MHWVLSDICGVTRVFSWDGASHVRDVREFFPHPKVTLSDPSPMSRKSSVVSWSGLPREQLEANVLPSEQSTPSGDVVQVAVLEDASGHWEPGEPAVISSFPSPVLCGTAPSTCPLKNVTNAPELSGELHGTITAARIAHRMSSAQSVSFVPSESSWCHELRTSAEGKGTVRRAGANPRRSREFNVKRNVNLWHNLKSVTKPQRPF